MCVGRLIVIIINWQKSDEFFKMKVWKNMKIMGSNKSVWNGTGIESSGVEFSTFKQSKILRNQDEKGNQEETIYRTLKIHPIEFIQFLTLPAKFSKLRTKKLYPMVNLIQSIKK